MLLGFILMLVASMTAGGAGLWVWIHTAAGHAWLRDRVESQLRKVIPGLSLGGFRLTLPDTIELREVIARDREGRPAVRIAKVRGRIDLRDLLGRKLRVGDLLVAEPQVEARSLANGQLNLAQLFAGGGAPQPSAKASQRAGWAWEIHDFALTDGVLHWQRPKVEAMDVDAVGSVGYASGSFHASVKLKAQGGLGGRNLSVTLDAAGEWSEKDIQVFLSRLTVGGVVPGGMLELHGSATGAFPSLAMQVQVGLPGEGQARVHGTLGFVHGLGYGLEIETTHVDPARLNGLLPPGEVSLIGEISGQGLPLSPSASATIRAKILPSTLAEVTGFTARLRGSLSGQAWRLESLAVEAPGVSATAKGSGSEREVALDVDASVRRPQRVAYLPRGLRGTARLNLRLRAHLPSTLEDLRATILARDSALRTRRPVRSS